MTGAGADDQISEEARLLADRVRERAAEMPTEADVAALAADALTTTTGGQMTPAEIRALAAEALAKAQQVSILLGRLANLLDPPAGEI
jgi:hypothetical protein